KHKSFLLFLIIALTAICAFLSMAFNLNYYDTIHCTIALSVGGAFGYFAYYNTFKINSLGKLKGWFLILLLGGIIVFSSSYILPKVLSFLLFSIATSLLIIYQINCASNYDLKRIPLIEKLGKYTYGFYMYHSIAIFLIYNLFTRFLNLDDNIYHTLITIPLLSLGLTIVMGYYSYHYIEIKFLKIKDKLNNVKDKSIPSYVCNDDNSKLNG
ncbi:MAG TPA: hypothetical protein PKN22_12040, partial [Taishania sp.]|nr:hypothetical protein [Taishania sp.]